ncbi:MAG: glycosyltransferase [Proteobacteria bacterium]|nr:glycosyltransferase [Pseudomonadota bacterium]
MSKIIVYQGEEGAYSHLACSTYYPDMEAVSCRSFAHAFELVRGGNADMAMIPVENSLAGRVSDIYHLLPEGGLHITAEHYLPVHHNLLALPGVKRAQIKTAYSHPMALSQVRHRLKNWGIMARGDRVIAVSQTAADYIKTHYCKYLKEEPKIIYRGIDPDKFPFGHEPDASWLQDLNTKHHRLVGHKIVLLPGRLTSLKGAKDLLCWLRSQDNSAKLVLTAKPENDRYAARLDHWFKEKGVHQRIEWIGLQSSMVDLYALSDIVVSPSIRPESFGRTVVESLAVGTPVVGYNHGGVGEILNELFPQGKVDLGNSQQLSDKINQGLNNKPTIKNTQPYLLSKMLEQTIALYQEALLINDVSK